MADIYHFSLQSKYESILRVVALDLGLGNDLTILTSSRLELVQGAAEQAILDWAARRKATLQPSRPISNLQHLLDEYCAIADHL